MSSRRTHKFDVRCSADELAAISARAHTCGRTISAFARESMLGANLRARRQQRSDDLIHGLATIARKLSALGPDVGPRAEIEAVLADLRVAIRELVRVAR